MVAFKALIVAAVALLSNSVYSLVATCDPALLKTAADEAGYQLIPEKGYCEGLVTEKHAGNLQLLYFMNKKKLGDSVVELYLRVPKIDTSGVPIEIRGISGLSGVTYRFDALANSGDAVVIDAAKTMKRSRIRPENIVFFGQVKNSFPPRLVPVTVSSQESPPQGGNIAIGLRIPVETKERRVRLVSSTGTGSSDWLDNKDIVSAGLVRIPLPTISSGVYRMEIILTPTLPIDPLVMTRDVVIP